MTGFIAARQLSFILFQAKPSRTSGAKKFPLSLSSNWLQKESFLFCALAQSSQMSLAAKRYNNKAIQRLHKSLTFTKLEVSN